MPKTFPIKLEVEEIALGTVLRRLNDMPGIVKLDLDLGHGGQGPGRKQLEDKAAARVQNGSREPTVIKLLMNGPKHIREISALLGGAKSRAYGITNTMSKKRIVERGEGAGMWQLTKKFTSQLGNALPTVTPVKAAVPALPAPGKAKHTATGRAVPGSGPIILRTVLAGGPLTPTELRAKLAEGGMAKKGVSGVIDRARKGGILKKNGTGYELTAKGMKLATGESAHG